MAGSGETVTYRESSRRAATGSPISCARSASSAATTMPSSWKTIARYVECGAAGERSGLYYTNVNSFLTAGELAYIVNNSLSKVLIDVRSADASRARGAHATARRSSSVSSSTARGEGDRVRNLEEATAAFPATPIADESLGAAMLYSSGTTGNPKGVLRPTARPAARENRYADLAGVREITGGSARA